MLTSGSGYVQTAADCFAKQGIKGEKCAAQNVDRRCDVVCVVVIALVSLIVFAGTWLYTDLSTEARLQSAFDASSYETITVVSGDSLWSIAEAHPVSGCTTQQVANHICESNNLESSYLATGIKLVVPKAGK